MIEFQCDYAEGAHPKILERMIETNMDQTPGYGLDPYCDEARCLIRKACGRENIDVQFLVGGTQTNTTIICSVLRPYQGVLTAASGHINVHESGAIEATGHKVLALPCGREGKITAEQIKAAYEAHMNDSSAEHMVQPGMVYILILLRMERFITGMSWKPSVVFAMNAGCRYSWMVPASAMA